MNNFAIETPGLKEARRRIKHFSEHWETSFDLSGLGLDQLPEDVFEYIDPEVVLSLNISMNKFEEIPSFIMAFSSMESLDASGNRLKKLPDAITALSSLKRLKVNDNDLMELPENIDRLAVLETLDVSRNKLVKLPESIKNLRFLKKFDFTLNKLAEVPSSVRKFVASQEINILTHIRKLAENASEAEFPFSDSFFEKAKSHVKALSEWFHLSDVQSVIYAQFLIRFEDQSIYLREIAVSLNLNILEMLPFMNEFDELERKKLLFCRRPPEGEAATYRVPGEVIESLRFGKPYIIETYKNVSIDRFFEVLDKLFIKYIDSEMSYTIFIEELNALIDNNMQLAFTQKLKALQLEEDNLVLLLRFCHRFASYDDESIGVSDTGGIFDNSTFRSIARALLEGDHELLKRGLIERVDGIFEDPDDFFLEKERFALTLETRESLFVELHLKPRKLEWKDSLTLSANIIPKQMFYNKEESERIRELGSILSGDNFKDVQKRLAEKGLRGGFTCLFSGASGTGKTETVYQIARETGRDLLSVDITDFQSKWVGESEKNLKAVFGNYRTAVKKQGHTPILLFNEADAVISRRFEFDNQSRSTDQMMNSLQNIILEEMEKLSGILIATTNFFQNMDKAFERRFLYKINFEKPGLLVRQAIWQSLMPDLSGDDVKTLAMQFDFSGGQIENVARKSIADYVLYGKTSSLERVILLCREEFLAKSNGKPLGFAV
ncbi:MAG: AAA family ATPase [Treponema sp.]|jgi:hypothetical protein|nr:AAA family ATPase [Treponema sp.]